MKLRILVCLVVVGMTATMFDGGGVVGIATDITERKRAENALRESEATFKAVINQLPVAITMKDIEGQRKLTNRTFDEWFTREDQDPLQVTNFDIFPKEVAEELLDQDAQIKRTGESITKEILLTFPDGSLHTVLMTKFPVRDENGTIIFIAAVDTDITERKRAEETLRASERRYATIRYVPIGRGCRAEGTVPENPEPDR